MGKRSKQMILQRRHMDGQKTHEKMFNITNYQRNANQNHNAVSPHTRQNGHHQKVYKQYMLERVWREGTLLDCWWECKLVQPLWKTLWRFLKKLKIELPFDPAIPPEHLPRENHDQKRYMQSNVHCSTIQNSQNLETT